MLSTPNYTWPYPESTDTPDVPRDVKNLALAADASLATVAAVAAVGTAIDPRGTYNRYSGTSTATALNGWTDIPFATRVDGAGTGLSVASNITWTLVKPGTWTVMFSGLVDASGAHPGVTGTIFALWSSTSHTTNTAYTMANFAVGASQSGGSVSAEIVTTGAATVVASVYTLGQASAMAITSGMLPRLSFSWKAN